MKEGNSSSRGREISIEFTGSSDTFTLLQDNFVAGIREERILESGSSTKSKYLI